MKRRATAALGAALLLAACGSGAPDAGGQPARAAGIRVGTALASEQVLARTLDAAPSSLDPAMVTETSAQHVLDDLFEGLATAEQMLGRKVNPTLYTPAALAEKIRAENNFVLRVLSQPKIFLIGGEHELPPR